MAQINYDVAAKSTAIATAGGRVVTRSSDTTYTLAGSVGISVTSTITKAELLQALKAGVRAIQRDLQSIAGDDVSALATSGDTTE